MTRKDYFVANGGTSVNIINRIRFAPTRKSARLFAPTGGIQIPPPAPVDPWIGKRVSFYYEGREGYGRVVAKNKAAGTDHYAVEMEADTSGHDCFGLVTRGRGWNVPAYAMCEASVLQGKRATLGTLDEVALVAPLVPGIVSPSRIGMRVEVQIDCATVLTGVIRHEDNDGTCAVEFDEGCEWSSGFHTCGGHVPSGRGWWCFNDTIRAVSEVDTTVEAERSEADTTVEAERSEADALNELDVSEVWAAYRINPSISIQQWIEARRVLKAAAK